MSTTTRRIIRLPALLDKLGGISKSTFHRRFRWLDGFPEPVDLPDGALAYFEDEIDDYLDSRPRTHSPRSNVADLPSHWLHSPRGNQRGNPNDDDHDLPPQAC